MVAPRENSAETAAAAAPPASPGAGRFQLSPARANPLRHLELAGLEVLELGAGSGGLSRSLAERAARLAAVEADPGQRAALAARLGDLPGTEVHADPASAAGLFDLVVVFEAPEPEAAAAFDRRLFAGIEKLKPGGILALACSNRLGLGFFAGQPHPGSGAYFAGIAGGQDAAGGRSRLEWRRRVDSLGFSIRAEYLLSPDVWLPSCVLRPELVDEDLELAADLFCHLPFADPRLPVFPLLPPALLAESLARGGLLADVAPGFLWLLGRAASGPLLAALGAGERGAGDPERSLGWHYSAERRPATATRFYLRGGELRVEKKALSPVPVYPGLRWCGETDQPLLRGRRWRQRLIRAAYFENGNFEEEMGDLLAELAGPFAAGREQLEGRALDAIFHNAIRGEDGVTRLFDLEWELEATLPASWWVLRNVLALAPSLETIAHGLGAKTLGELYARLCARLGLAPAPEGDLDREAAFQAQLGDGDATQLAAALRALLERPLGGSPFPPRHPEKIGPWGEEMRSKSLEIEKLSSAFEGLTKLSADVRWLAEAVDRQQRSLESIDEALRWLATKIVEKP